GPGRGRVGGPGVPGIGLAGGVRCPSEDSGDDLREAGDRVEAVQFLRPDPAVLDVLPVEPHLPVRRIEEERVDDVHSRIIPGKNGSTCGTECQASQSRLLPNFLCCAVLRIFSPFQVAGDRGPATSEASDVFAPTHDEDARSVSEDYRDHGRRLDVGQLDGPAIAVDRYPIPGTEASDIDAVHERDAR